ncbi:hypothetical protein JCM19000A_36690 [Silvimonas sp. JCM 19000]
MKPLLIASLLACAASASVQAQLITFSDFVSPNTGSTMGQPATYQGLEIDGFFSTVTASADYVPFPSGTQALSNNFYWGGPVQTLRGLTPFIFASAEVAPLVVDGYYGFAADGLQIDGYRNGIKIATATYDFGAANPDFAWYYASSGFDQPVDTLAFTPLSFGFKGQGYLLDALNITPVPEPATWALLGIGAVAVFARRRSHLRKP